MFDYDYFASLESTCDRIKNHRGGLFAYGTGNGCEKLIKLLKEENICLDGIFASDDFARGQSFCGFEVKPLSQIDDDCTVLLAFGSDLPEVMWRVENLEKKHTVIAPDMALFDDYAFDKGYFLENFEKAERAYNLLGDEMSRKTFEKISAYKITGNLKFLREVFVSREEFVQMLDLGENEIYCDFGAYNGDTVREFLNLTKGRYRHIFAVEPSKKNFQKCVKNCINLDNITFKNMAVWEKNTLIDFSGASGRQGSVCGKNCERKLPCVSIDSMLGGGECTYIKLDVEGADFQALKGGENTIKKYMPEIFTALYHHPYDYFEIPLFIDSLCKGYDFYIRQAPYYPCWETNLLCKKSADKKL